MKEKNRFSILLERLMSMADLKNYVLAKSLQYDESYISKWTSGKLLPAEKSYDKILQSISHCIIESLTEESLALFQVEYQLQNLTDLEKAIYDNLETEYNYVKDLKTTTGSEIASQISHYPELTLVQFISKMKHPSLRNVKSLDVCAVVDILNLDPDYQFMIADINGNHNERDNAFPGVHFSLFINLDSTNCSDTYTAIFLMNLLTNLSNIDFQLYAGVQALSKVVFTVKDAYSISGMLIDNNYCLAVTTCEDLTITNALYKKLKALCNQETLLVRKLEMRDIIQNFDYERSLFSQNQNLLLGHLTEHFVPDSLHEELLNTYCQSFSTHDLERLRKLHIISKRILESSSMNILIFESALTAFTVSGTLDFYGYKITLTSDQRLQCMNYLLSLFTNNKQLQVKLIQGKLISDFQHIANPTLFLTDSFCYFRLEKNSPQYNICVPNKQSLIQIMTHFYQDIWNNPENGFIDDTNYILGFITHIIHSIEIISDL